MQTNLRFGRQPIEIRYATNLRDAAGNEAHAATFLRRRLIVLDTGLRRNRAEHQRILAHELLHFAWVRLGNVRRREWEEMLALERDNGVRGEAGWSAEWRKNRLRAVDLETRSRRWREYCCEAFCDTGAWLSSGVDSENTLGQRSRKLRSKWFGHFGLFR